jgi:type IV secretory pathway TrbD component
VETKRPRLVPIHQSFLQPLLILGVERELLVITAILAATLVFSFGNAYLAVVGALLWLVTLPVLQRLAKVDPQMSRVYVRHACYARYFPAHPHCTAPTRERPDWA